MLLFKIGEAFPPADTVIVTQHGLQRGAGVVHGRVVGAGIGVILGPEDGVVVSQGVEPAQSSHGAADNGKYKSQGFDPKAGTEIGFHIYTFSILYPRPQTTLIYLGLAGSISIFSRMWRMWTATVFSEPKAASFHTCS